MQSNPAEMIRDLMLGYLGLMSLIGFILMGVDKQKAKNRAWRIPERTLFLIAFLGGGPGSLLGMYTFHHKTKHNKFRILIPIAALLTLYAAYILIQ